MADDNTTNMNSGTSMYNLGRSMSNSELDNYSGGNGKSGGMYDGGLDQITKALRDKALVAETQSKAYEKEKGAERARAGKEITNMFVDMPDQFKSLGPESLTQAQEEVSDLRQRMFAAIDAEDQKEIAAINKELTSIKTRHSGDADGLTTMIGQWEDDLVSTAGMTAESMDVFKNFQNNKSKKAVYKDGVLHYQWQKIVDGEPVVDTDDNGEPLLDENGQPMYKLEEYTLEQLNDMIVPSDNVNGMQVMDYVEAQKKVVADGENGPDNAALKKEMRKIIPTDAKALRDWTYGNPAGADDLDIYGYLMDHDFWDGYEDVLGLKDKNGDGMINDEDWDATQTKESIITAIMDVTDPIATHEIISDIYASISANNIRGKENKDYHPDRQKLPNATNQEEALKDSQLTKLDFLESLKTQDGLLSVKGLNETQIANKFNLTPADLENGIVDENGEMINISTFIADAKDMETQGNTGGNAR